MNNNNIVFIVIEFIMDNPGYFSGSRSINQSINLFLIVKYLSSRCIEHKVIDI